MAEMPNWTKKCQIRIKIQTTELKLKIIKYFGLWEKMVHSRLEWC